MIASGWQPRSNQGRSVLDAVRDTFFTRNAHEVYYDALLETPRVLFLLCDTLSLRPWPLTNRQTQMDMVPRQHWADYKINIDVGLAKRVVSLLRDQDFPDVEEDPEFDWHDDTVTPAKWMFPEGTPPATVISMNARFDPVFHVRIGQAISSLRKEGILIIGTG